MSDEKPHEATPARIARARREGDLPRSSQITAVASLAVAVIAASFQTVSIAPAARTALFTAAQTQRIDGTAYLNLALSALMVVCAGALGALIGSFAQTRGFAMRMPELKLERLNPAAGFKRMFSREALLSAIRALTAASVVLLVLASLLHDVLLISVMGVDMTTMLTLVSGAVRSCALGMLAVGLVFGIFEFLSEQKRWRERLRLSTSELKRDHKENDGDPHVRSRRRRAHRSLMNSSIDRVREASFVVANPTHVAIGLAYGPPLIAVPRIVVRATDDAALVVKQRARELSIPVVENVALARLLLATADVDDPIPRETYGVIARIVAGLLDQGQAL
ncbi:MAG TPA: EscU/YscU/HrcU family type III secretion system export apparatus switch protein [Candidatus Baltobacteraceae bacterium]|jgi:flagellar biosynthetic protein FlhB|nr:EscU/YscU/HrcU family type III secretion system export apparatus switch protein [Candidatus Baltobacteraceae bacterium]